jgi:mono/diheme cytochrome c family protein
MRKVSHVFEWLAVVAAVAFVVLLFANEPDDRSAPAASAPVSGDAVFAANCATCHGRDGRGGPAPVLADGRVVDDFPDPADQIAFVTNGRGRMPAFGGRLSPEEIEAVVEYTRTELAGGQ